jgi:putative spermidine/putrescine transport system permease protein
LANSTSTGRKRAWSPATSYGLILAFPLVFLLVLFLMPLALVVLRALTTPELGFQNFIAAFSSDVSRKVLLNTFRIAATVTALCLIIAYPVAYAMSKLSGGWLTLALAFVLVPFWTSVVVRTFAWIILFQRFGPVNKVLMDLGIINQPLGLIYNSLGVHIGMVQALLPLMVLPLLNVMKSIDRTYTQAAEVLGANPLQSFWHVYLPLSMPGVTAGTLLVFLTAVGFYVTPALLGGTGDMMASILIEQYITRTLNWPLASALATILLVITVIFYCGYEALSRRVGGLGVLD